MLEFLITGRINTGRHGEFRYVCVCVCVWTLAANTMKVFE